MSGENKIAERVDAVGNRANGVAAHYEYAPFGEVTAQVRQGGVTAYDFAALNPWRFSSEYADDASTTVYYNYRHYEPVTGRWLVQDYVAEHSCNNLFVICENALTYKCDYIGAIGLTIGFNKYQMQSFRVVTEFVYCPYCDCYTKKCVEPCEWRLIGDEVHDMPLVLMNEVFTGGLTSYDIANVPFTTELQALENSKYKDYLFGNTYHAFGYDDYIFTGYDHKIVAYWHYPQKHLIVPSCKNESRISTYYKPIGNPYWTYKP